MTFPQRVCVCVCVCVLWGWAAGNGRLPRRCVHGDVGLLSLLWLLWALDMPEQFNEAGRTFPHPFTFIWLLQINIYQSEWANASLGLIIPAALGRDEQEGFWAQDVLQGSVDHSTAAPRETPESSRRVWVWDPQRSTHLLWSLRRDLKLCSEIDQISVRVIIVN